MYLQARGTLLADLVACLRKGRSRRVSRSRSSVSRGQIPDMINISERPPQVEDRAVLGFWEGHLIIGKDNASQIATLLERTTRFVMLVKIPYDRNASRVAYWLAEKMKTLPEFLKRSLTWDQGKEMTRHKEFTIATGMPVFFCDPHSPWQRGSNETPPSPDGLGGAPRNGLLCQYFPKSTDLSVYSQADLDAVAKLLNGRPRATLDWQKPVEALEELRASQISG